MSLVNSDNPFYSPSLIVFSSDGVASYDLGAFPSDTITFGRAGDNDIVINSPLVSRRHGYIMRDGNSYVIVNDPESTNGLLFQERLIPQVELRDGDSIRIDRIVRGTDESAFCEPERDPDGVLLLFTLSLEEDDWQEVPVGRQSLIRIGRDRSCDVHIAQASVSRIHALIEKRDGGWTISDNGSTNGVLLNGRLLNEHMLLHEKDVIVVGGVKIVFTSRALYYHAARRGISVEARDVSRTVSHGKLTICDHANLFIRGGELVALIGGSGAGKTTLMNCLCGYTKPTEGEIYVGGEDLYRNLSHFRQIIGYVPQADIVFDNLTVRDMLRYSARLRLPADTTAEEREARIAEVLAMTELTGKEDTPIRRLSGGQKKRVSIAVELIPDPDLLFLDEPTSGLDPETERSLMGSLKRMARAGKTVILVTHSTLQLQLCDKIAFMGKGGRMCFFGGFSEALDFFGVNDIVDVYRMMTEDSAALKERYDELSRQVGNSDLGRPQEKIKKPRTKGALRQLGILTARNLKLLFNDGPRLALMFLQAPLLAVLIWLVSDGKQFEQYDMTYSILFALACSAFWLGTLNAIQEVCKERVILRREYMTGEKLGSYLASKFLLMAVVSLVQAALLIGVFALIVGYPEEGLILPPVWELMATTALTILAAATMGLFVSCLFKNADRAMTLAPLLLMPQILFSGVVFKIRDEIKAVSWFVTCRWAMKGYGATADLNALPTSMMQEGIPMARTMEEFFDHTKENLLESWGLLALFVIAFLILGRIALENVKKEQ